ncbi:MAG: hypothetical protein V4612_03100 [Pseudomonadota bacterium]
MKKIFKENLIIFYAILIFWLPVKIMTGMMEIKFLERVGFVFGFSTLLFLSLISLLLAFMWLKNKSNRFVFINTPLLLSFLLGVLGILFSIFINDPKGGFIANIIGVVLSTFFFFLQLLIWSMLFILSLKKSKKHLNN